jgi:serine/threonine protein kinase
VRTWFSEFAKIHSHKQINSRAINSKPEARDDSKNVVEDGEPVYYALKRYFNRAGRDDFDNERNILEALSVESHDHIALYLGSWSDSDSSYTLFTLANGNLHQLLRQQKPKLSTNSALSWLVAQFKGLCSAISYIHDYCLPSGHRRLGFHHDLKPENILLFQDTSKTPICTMWAICDFGSGTIVVVPEDEPIPEIYNRKASTGDPIYSAPEYVIEGRVTRSKDIWSLGCIFLEVLVWVLSPEDGSVEKFHAARDKFSADSADNEATYWCLGKNGLPYMNPAVEPEIERVQRLCNGDAVLTALLKVTRSMIVLDPLQRPTAAELSESGFKAVEEALLNIKN